MLESESPRAGFSARSTRGANTAKRVAHARPDAPPGAVGGLFESNGVLAVLLLISSLFLLAGASWLAGQSPVAAPRHDAAPARATNAPAPLPGLAPSAAPPVAPSLPPSPSGAPPARPSPTPVDDAWRREVERAPWEGVARDSPSLCANAQKGLVPAAKWKFGKCNEVPGYSNTDGEWPALPAKLLSVNCSYAPSESTRRYTLNVPSRNASVYIVYATSAPIVDTHIPEEPSLLPPPYESYGERYARAATVKHTLGTLRQQFGDALELTVVQLDDTPLDEERDFGLGVVNTLLTATWKEGQDWGMYQDGLHAVWGRLRTFKWVLVMNDRMLGPVVHLPDTLAQATASGAGLWASSTMPGCCIRGFALGFAPQLVASDSWQSYWERIHFPCGKIGPMLLGEGGITQIHNWHGGHGGCAASSPGTVGKGFTLQMQRERAPTVAFIYSWGLFEQYLPGLGKASTVEGVKPGVEAACVSRAPPSRLSPRLQ